MKRTLLLFLSSDRLHAQLMAGGKIAVQREFSATPEGKNDFAAFLQNVKFPAYMLVDLIEEDFRQETVPHLRGSNRVALLQRKFEQFYRGSPFHQATLLHRQKTGRRDDDMLFSALTNPALITPWLDIMLAQQIPLAGVYSVPQISAPLINDYPSKHLLLVSWGKFSGLRQTYFMEHRLQISRLTSINADLTFHDAVLNEIPRTYQYLKSLSLLPHGQILDVLLLGNSHDLIDLQRELPRSEDMRYDFADLADIARQHNINYNFTDSDASQVFLHQLAAHTPQANYADATHTHYFRLRQLKHTLNLASATLLLGCLLWAAANLWQSGSDAAEAGSLRVQAQHTLGEAQQIIQKFPDIFAHSSDVKSGVSVMHKLNQHGSSMPGEVLQPIGEVLDGYPQIELDNLAWQMDASEPVVPGTHADIPAQVITIKGHLIDFANDYRTALNYLEQFQRGLTTQGYQVTALATPLDVSPDGSIADQRETGKHSLDFSLKLSLRPSL